MEQEAIRAFSGKVCAFSGYRPAKMPFSSEDDPACRDLKQRLREEIRRAAQDGYTEFLCGMALGVDTWAAEEVIALRESLRGTREIFLHAYLPFPKQDARWSAKQRCRYHGLLTLCDSITVVSPSYLPDAMERRNRAMIERAERLIAVFDGKKGGTRNTVLMAHEAGIELRILSPVPPQPHQAEQIQEAEPSQPTLLDSIAL